jgi:frataxin
MIKMKYNFLKQKIKTTFNSYILYSALNVKFFSINSHNNSKELPKISFDKYYKEVQNLLESLYEDIDSQELEIVENISLSDGVLNIALTGNKKYVINMQRPNLQVWLSSPISGPQRYEFNLDSNKWLNIRNNINIYELLEKEFNSISADNSKGKVQFKH